jgi:hypothetical protein
MEHVFLLFVWLGAGQDARLVSNDMYFRDVDRCLYFASRITKTFVNYNDSGYRPDSSKKITAYCLPKYVPTGSRRVY